MATLLATSTSAVVTLASSGIDRPSQLDGKVYASYGARYEGRIVQQMIRNDGGKGDYTESTPPMLGIWNTLLKVPPDGQLPLDFLPLYHHLLTPHLLITLTSSRCICQGEADATWVFMGWEGVEAELKGVKLNSFKLEDFKVPYGHSPLLVTHPDIIRSDTGLAQLQRICVHLSRHQSLLF